MDEDQEQRFAQAERLRQGYRRRGRRRLVIGFLSLLIVLGGVGAFAAYQIAQDQGAAAPDNASAGFGFTLTAEDLDPDASSADSDDAVRVDLWVDYFCAECRRFNEDVRGYLRQAVRRGSVELTYHPLLVRKDASTNNYAERAANAAACVADGADVAAFAKMHDLLLKRQPGRGEAGASTATLIAWAESAGADDVEECIEELSFLPWLEEAVAEGGVDDAPMVRVADREIVSPGKDGGVAMPDRKELRFAIESAE